MKTNKSEYLFMMINAQRLLSKYQVQEGKTGKPYIHYSFDFTKKWERKYFISSIEEYDDCALFYQLSKVHASNDYFINPYTENDVQDNTPKGALINTALLFVDFGDIFNKINDEKNLPCEQMTFETKDLLPSSKTINTDYRMKSLFRHGLHVRYGDKEITYVPFDKSNSMARNNKMSFIAAELCEPLNERLLMDIPFDKIHVPLSKFYAYKGLYLSSGSRVEHEKLLFNSETFIVINDQKYKVPHQSILTAKRKGDTQAWSLEEQNDITELIDKAFDGEGIISREYSVFINEAFGYNLVEKGDTEKITSFQVRMPFVKGMLHRVDFHRFLSEYAAKTGKPLYIKDIFGKTRDLSKAQVIIPTSMFKWNKWLETYINSVDYKHSPDYIDDPMVYYFDYFKKYDHALYVTNTNLDLGKKKYTTLNYQFLNTLLLKHEQLEALVNDHLEKANHPIEYLLHMSKVDMDEDTVMDDSNLQKVPAWISVLSQDPKFAHEAKIQNELITISNSLKSDCGFGRLIVDGEVRFLSRDLLHFLTGLLYMMDQYNNARDNEATIKLLNNRHALYADNFYMPENNIYLNPSRYYAIFRNPHLSRNEQCALRPYYTKDADNIYNKYFSHLSGIIMVSYDSLDPQALGGADFDGDLVKIIHNPHITNAVLNGAYQKVQDKATKKRLSEIYKRKLPIIKIPSTSGPDAYVKNGDDSFYTTIKNTFSSKVGLISNLAIRLGQIQYASLDCELEHVCEECTILTGLEIDAAKSGEHPDLTDLIAYYNTLSEDLDYIKKFKTPLKELLANPYYHLSAVKPTETEDGPTFELKLKKTDKKSIISYTYRENSSTLMRLPYYFFTNLATYKPEVKEDEKEGGRYRYFSFMKQNNWTREVDSDLRAKISAVVAAHNKVLHIAKAVNKYINRNKSANFINYIYNLVLVQYDNDKALAFLEDTLNTIMVIIEETLPTCDDITAAITRLHANNWAFLLPSQKETALKDILQIDEHHEIYKYADYLYNFDAQGYNTIFYLLKNILAEKAAETSNEEIAMHFQEDSTTDLSNVDLDTYDTAFEKLFEIYIKETSYQKSPQTWKKQIFATSKKMIHQFLKEADVTQKECVMTMYSIKGNADKNSSFFWDFFSAEELLPYISGKEELQC